MKPLTRLWLCLFAWLCLPLHAGDPTAYRIGDIADADITTPVALDVEDAAATAALRLAKAEQFPAVFRNYPDATNAMTREFLATFAQARTNFWAELAGEFKSAPMSAATIASADFGRLVTAFGVENKKFPVPDELAAEWARGGDGQAIREKLRTALLRAGGWRIMPDTFPKDLVVSQTIRLVTVSDPNQKLSFDAVQHSPLVPVASLTTVSNAQALFRREFPAGQQLFARALAAFIQPNCLPDAPFTQLTRGTAVCQMIVANHFDAGDVIIHRGDTIDAKTKAALDALHEKLMARPPVPAVAAANIQPTPSPATSAPATVAHSPALNPPKPTAKAGGRHEGLIVTLAGVSAVALLVAGWQFLKEKQGAPKPATAAETPLPFPDGSPTDLPPQVAQVVREAVQQELALQRRELLLAQQAAADEIAALVRRLDELQVPLQERTHTYEARIQMLEKELALRNQENRELLKLKIEMISRQLEAERAGNLSTPMAA